MDHEKLLSLTEDDVCHSGSFGETCIYCHLPITESREGRFCAARVNALASEIGCSDAYIRKQFK